MPHISIPASSPVRRIPGIWQWLPLILMALATLPAQEPVINPPATVTTTPAWGQWPRWGDQGDGTFRNPVLPADYSDLDCIRVGDEYVAIASTMQYAPGMVILRSRDLVNWTIAGHAVTDVSQIGSEMNWDHLGRFGRGIWAGAIRHHAGRYWVFFGTPDEGYFMTSATDLAGPWTPLHCLKAEPGWDDCCPFWDNDGRAWFVGTSFKDGYKTYLWPMSADGRTLDDAGRVLINQGGGREANKLYKIDGWYYHLFSESGHQNATRVVVMQRARSLQGPWEKPRQLTAPNSAECQPNQGGLVQAPNGRWWFLTHHGQGDWEGRCVSLLPVTWIDGWPIIGATDATGAPGTMVWSGPIPVPGQPRMMPQTSDDFSAATLGPQWEWRNQPRAGFWSLSERSGWLRLKAYPSQRRGDLSSAGNILTQRPFRAVGNVVTVACDVGGMVDGQRAGLCRFAGSWANLGVVQQAGKRRLECRIEHTATQGPELSGNRLWLRTTWGLDGQCRFSYSLDGTAFTNIGGAYKLSWGGYRGDRIGLYTFTEQGEAGCFDVDALTYDLPAH